MSHDDHGLSRAQYQLALDTISEAEEGVVVTTIPVVGLLPCGLYGPIMGDEPQTRVAWGVRGNRAWASRLVNEPRRFVAKMTVIGVNKGIAGPTLWTAYGGPQAPREPWDNTMTKEEREESLEFWKDHALAEE